MELSIWGEISIFYFDCHIIMNFKRIGGLGLHLDRNFEVNVGRAAYVAYITSWSFDSN